MPALCDRCGSDKLIEDAKVEDHITAGRRVALEVMIGHQKGSGMRGDKPVRVPIKARICGECGFTELYVSEPARLWRLAQKINRAG